MKRHQVQLLCALATMVGAMATQPASALVVVADYRYDTSISLNPAAKAGIDAAAAELSRVITTSLTPLDLSVPHDYSASVRSYTAAVRVLSANATIPRVTTPDENPYAALAADQVVMFVGSAALPGAEVGEGIVGTPFYTLSFIATPQPDNAAAIDAAVAYYNSVWRRGANVPIVDGDDFNSSLNGFGIPATAAITHIGPTFGGITFDTGRTWTADAAYSTALHEMLHGLGFSSDVFQLDGLVNGNEWLGPNARALNGGSGYGLLDGSHLSQNLMSPRITDGVLQTPVMAPNTTGGRQELTLLDLAILKDLGYTVVPEPSAGAMVVLAASLLLATDRRRATRAGK